MLISCYAPLLLEFQMTVIRVEEEQQMDYLMHSVLLRRYAIVDNGKPTDVSNVLEMAVDLHALLIISTSGYQKTIRYLWKGWLVQSNDDSARFVDYREKANTNYLVHVDPNRLHAPVYQHAMQI